VKKYTSEIEKIVRRHEIV